MGRLENRVKRLEETVERGGFAAAFSQATDEDIFALAGYVQRAQQANEAGEPTPLPTSDEEAAAQRFEELRAAAVRAGWGRDAYRIV